MVLLAPPEPIVVPSLTDRGLLALACTRFSAVSQSCHAPTPAGGAAWALKGLVIRYADQQCRLEARRSSPKATDNPVDVMRYAVHVRRA